MEKVSKRGLSALLAVIMTASLFSVKAPIIVLEKLYHQIDLICFGILSTNCFVDALI